MKANNETLMAYDPRIGSAREALQLRRSHRLLHFQKAISYSNTFLVCLPSDTQPIAQSITRPHHSLNQQITSTGDILSSSKHS
jgi:hypothetical protein